MQERVAALDRDDPTVAALIEQARAAIEEGDYEAADRHLIQAESADLAAARQAVEQASQRFRNAAATRAIRGETNLTRLRYLDAAEHFAAAAGLVPESEPKARAGYLALQGAALDRGDRTLDAIAAHEQATALDPDAAGPWIDLGRLCQRAGNLGSAEQAFLSGRGAAEREDDAFRIGLANEGLGEVKLAQGNLGDALAAYQARHGIIEGLAAKDPANSEWQRDLSVSHDRIGDVRAASENLPGALAAHEASLGIREALAAKDASNSEWQRDLVVANAKMSEVTIANDEPGKARRHLKAALAIAEDLERTGRLRPVDVWMVGDLKDRLDHLVEPASGSGK